MLGKRRVDYAPQSFRNMDASFKRGCMVYFFWFFHSNLYVLRSSLCTERRCFCRTFCHISIRYLLSSSQRHSLGRRGRSRALTASLCNTNDSYYGVLYSYSECLASLQNRTRIQFAMLSLLLIMRTTFFRVIISYY